MTLTDIPRNYPAYSWKHIRYQQSLRFFLYEPTKVLIPNSTISNMIIDKSRYQSECVYMETRKIIHNYTKPSRIMHRGQNTKPITTPECHTMAQNDNNCQNRFYKGTVFKLSVCLSVCQDCHPLFYSFCQAPFLLFFLVIKART